MSAKKDENAASRRPKSEPMPADQSVEETVVDAPPPALDGQKEQPSKGESERVEASGKIKEEVAQQPARGEPLVASYATMTWQMRAVIIAALGVIVASFGVFFAAASAENAAKAAKAAQDGIALTREMSQLQQRAWVAPVAITGEPRVGQPFRVDVLIRNSGNTFAKGVRVATYFISIDDATMPNYAKADAMVGTRGTPAVALLSPNTTYRLSAFLNTYDQKKLNAAEVDAIMSGKVQVYAYGKIVYSDIFGVEHWTTYSARYHEAGYQATEQFNDADGNRSPPPKEAKASEAEK